MDHYSFGIEIEISAVPRHVQRPLQQQLYYESFAQALRARGLQARADDLTQAYRKHREEYNRGWFITRDGSIGSTSSSSVQFEAVSPILSTRGDWEDTIDRFWKAQRDVFDTPTRSTTCGSHVHISPRTGQRWSIDQLRNIAVGVAYLEGFVEEMLPEARRGNTYCRKNTASSSTLSGYTDQYDRWHDLLSKVRGLDKSGLIRLMQTDRHVLWNFEPTGENGVGSIEFRGGRCLRGPVRTKRWIAFAVAYINLLLELRIYTTGRYPDIRDTHDLYSRIRRSANKLDLKRYLPSDHHVLSESRGRGSAASSRNTFHVPPAYPSDPPPAYARAERNHDYDMRLERGNDATHSNSRHNDEGGCSSAWLWTYGILRLLQIVFAAAVLGLYGGPTVSSLEPKFFYAMVTAGTAALVAAIHLIGLLSGGKETQGIWKEGCGGLEVITDGVISIMWAVVFGIFGKVYISEGDAVHPRMFHAVWLDLFNMVLWLVTEINALRACFGSRD